MKVLAVAGDAGGARAIEPVMMALGRRPGVHLDARPYRSAVDIWQASGFDIGPIEGAGTFTHALLGTSVGTPIRELEVIERARACGARTVAVVDHWLNYRDRFVRDGDLILPDAIALMDQRAFREAVADGLPAERLVVTGHPALEAILPASLDRRAAERTKLGTTLPLRADRRILWVAQPFLQTVEAPTSCFIRGEEPPRRIDHRSDEALVTFARVLGRVAEELGVVVDLIVKPHPRDLDRPIPNIAATRWLAVHRVPDGYAPRDAVLGVDVVCGMQSMLLLEACCLSQPVVSFQPDLQLPNPLPITNDEQKGTYSVHDEAALTAALRAAFAASAHPEWTAPLSGLHRGATDRIIALLSRVLESSPRHVA